ncbi:hypothetical protein V8G54_000963 [Vigna mungo]|uniref:DUF7890 domain-containing protein n=1 Tax=Vigna mungo TaxID=3915 RepID=A0AAQ3S7R1_VIGMU
MIGSMFACLGGKVSRRKAKVEAVEVRKGVYRDELKEKERVKKSVRFAEVEATIMGEENEKEFRKRGCDQSDDEVVGEKEGVRVRVRLTKEEAARLLSKCNEGSLQLKDIAHQLLFIPVDRLCIQSSLYH